jgi:hypothetical protein
MRFTVVWSTTAENDLASVWLEADDREEVAAAADLLDLTLRDEANLVSGRILFSPPIAIDFEISIEERIVRVLSRWNPH